MSNKQGKRHIINIGTSLLVVVLIGLSLSVIAALAMSTAKHNYDLSENLGQHTKEYYEASNEAYELLDENGYSDGQFTVPLTDDQVLLVEIENTEIVTWQVVNASTWEPENSITLMTEEN